MFGIRVFPPMQPLDLDAPQVTAQLEIADARLIFSLDLRYWRVRDYQRQWKSGIDRLVLGAHSSALMTAFRGRGGEAHHMWALWRADGRLHVQRHCVLPSEIAEPFDPLNPYEHVEARIPVTEEGLPLTEWSVELDQFFAAALRIRWPFAQ